MSAHKILILVATLWSMSTARANEVSVKVAAGAPPAKAPSKAAPTAAAPKPITTLELGVKAYNLVQGVSKLFLAMKLGTRADDATYLDGLAEKYKDVRLPKAWVKNGDIYLQGLPAPIKVVDLKEGQFSYKNKSFDLNMKDGAEATFDALQNILYPKPVALISWILPEAEAQSSDSSMTMLAAIAGVGGFAMAADQCGDEDGSTVGCGVGGLLSGFGIGYLLAAAFDKTPPNNMQCYPGQNGCSQVVLMGPRGVPVNTIAQCPGQAVSYNPALRQVPLGIYGAPRMASSLAEMCSYPTTMMTMNSAYAAPVPLMYTTPTTAVAGNLLPLNNPGVPLVNGRPPVILPAAKPAARTPATTFPQQIEAGK